MEDLGLVGVLDALEDLEGVGEGPGDVEALLPIEDGLEGLALHVLHDDEEDAVHALGGENADDVLMVEGGQEARLLEHLFFCAALTMRHLDGDLLVDPGVLGEEHRPEATGA